MNRSNRLGVAALAAVTTGFLFGAVASPPDPYTQVRYTVPTAVVAFPVLYWAITRAESERIGSS